MTWSELLAKKISGSLGLDPTQSEIIAYGAFAFLQIVLSLTVVALLGWLLGSLWQALIVSFAASILRQYSGGVHAGRPSVCLIVGTAATILVAFLSDLLALHLSVGIVAAVGLSAFLWAFFIILKKAPVDSPAKPIKTEKKRLRMRRISVGILVIYFILDLCLVLAFLQTGIKSLLAYSVCIYGAVGWQVFNLTQVGHIVLKKVDGLLDHMLFGKGGAN